MRFVTRTIRCERTASTEPNSFSIHGYISLGGSRWPTVSVTSNKRSTSARDAAGSEAMRARRSTIEAEDVTAIDEPEGRSLCGAFLLRAVGERRLVESHVFLRRDGPGVILAHADRAEPREAGHVVECLDRAVAGLLECGGIVRVQCEAVAVRRMRVGIAHGVDEPTDEVDDGHRAVAERDQLSQPARLESRRHQKE